MNKESYNHKISIIVPVYNTKKYLKKCILSIINQTYKNIEIILINDGSTDGSYKICNFFSKRDKRIKFINKKNEGLSSARNAGLINATGEYISFVDSDDFIEKNTYATLVQYLNTNIDIIIFGYRKIKDSISTYEYTTHYQHLNKINAIEELIEDKSFYNYMWNKLYNIRLFDKYKFTEGKVYEDIDIQYKLFSESANIITIPHTLYNYTIRNDSITNSKNINHTFDNIHIHIERFFIYNIKLIELNIYY